MMEKFNIKVAPEAIVDALIALTSDERVSDVSIIKKEGDSICMSFSCIPKLLTREQHTCYKTEKII